MNYVSTSITRGPTLWPDKMVVKMKYSDYDTIDLLGDDVSAAFGNQYAYRANDCFYPRSASISDSIPGRIEFAYMYKKYRVIASAIKVTVSASGYPVFVVVVPDPVATLGAGPTFGPAAVASDTIKGSAGATYAKSKLIISASNDQHTIYSYISMAKIMGSQEAATNDYYAGFTGVNGATPISPAQIINWKVTACRYDEEATTEPTLFSTEITYWVEFYGRDLELA